MISSDGFGNKKKKKRKRKETYGALFKLQHIRTGPLTAQISPHILLDPPVLPVLEEHLKRLIGMNLPVRHVRQQWVIPLEQRSGW